MPGDQRVRDGYPDIQDDAGDTEGDAGNPGVPQDYLDKILEDDDQ